MLNIIIGMVVMVLGVWVLTNNWWAFLDLIYVAVPTVLVVIGGVMLLAGIRGKMREEPEEA